MSPSPEEHLPEPTEAEIRDGEAAWAESGLGDALAAFETPAPSDDFADETALRLALHRHDPGLRADRAGTAYTDRVVSALVSQSATPAPARAPARAPAPIEMRSSRAPYLVAAAILLATSVALLWPKGPGPTGPKIEAVAEQLDAGLRAVSDPATAASSLVPTVDFSSTKDVDLFEIPRFAPPSLAEFQAADLATRAVTNGTGEQTR